MRLALISDVHANYEALRGLSNLLEDADKVICLGDLVGYYCQVNEVIDLIRTLDTLCILGNHDSFLLNGCPHGVPEAVQFGIDYAQRVIDPNHLAWLATLPLSWGGCLDGTSLLLAHGSPWKPLTDYLYPNSPQLDQLAAFDFDIIAFGQTHRPVLRTAERPFLLNPGAVGQSRHTTCMACAAIVDTQRMDITLIERPYDPSPVLTLAKQQGAGAWIHKHLS